MKSDASHKISWHLAQCTHYRMQKYRLGPYENLPAEDEPETTNKGDITITVEDSGG